MALPAARFSAMASPLESDGFATKSSLWWDRFKRFTLRPRDEDANSSNDPCSPISPTTTRQQQEETDRVDDILFRPGLMGRRLSRKVIPGLPRPGTFRRQQSEHRDNLRPHEPSDYEQRSVSVGRRRAVSSARRRCPTPPPVALPSLSAPEVGAVDDEYSSTTSPINEAKGYSVMNVAELTEPSNDASQPEGPTTQYQPPPPPPPFSDDDDRDYIDRRDELINTELDQKWILNLSMKFRDRSDREKFFVTYLDTSEDEDVWRRVTVSCDYRDAPRDSLEQDLKNLQYQRDKSARIYESIRESLPDIQFYRTVTNLKLETSEGRLHVHVTEDLPELIPYPSLSSIGHLQCPKYQESELTFESHLSGFVYKVKVGDQIFIKKEIPGPDAVEEFLYEINALHSLEDSNSVIKFGGVIVDDKDRCIKGLLISYASQGAMVDILYDDKGRLPWKRRERWAKQIVEGLSEIHEAGFAQGDFTLSNIVVDEKDDAKIIDINRRGCPVGWEPPEILDLIKSSQRVTMYIGVKSDLFQLGMVLWSLAEEIDEPESQPRPLTLANAGSDIPQYYRDLVSICMSERPRERLAAKSLLDLFPEISEVDSRPAIDSNRDAFSSVPSEKQYIDPSAAVEREDLDYFRQRHSSEPESGSPEARRSTGEATYIEPPTSVTDYSDIYVVPRGRSGVHKESISSQAIAASKSVAPDQVNTDQEIEQAQILAVSPGDEKKWEEVELGGNPFLIRTGLVTPAMVDFKSGEMSKAEQTSTTAATVATDEIVLPGPKVEDLQLEPVVTSLSEDGGVFTGIGSCHGVDIGK